MIFILFSPNEQRGGGGEGGRCQTFFRLLFFPVQQTTSGIGHREKQFFGAGNQYAECEKQQEVQMRSDFSLNRGWADVHGRVKERKGTRG